VLAYITHLLIEKPGIELGKELNPYTEAIV